MEKINPADFQPYTPTKAINSIAPTRRVSYLSSGFRSLLTNRLAVTCLVILSLIILGAIFIPMFSPFDYQSQNVAFANKAFLSRDPITGQMHIFGTDNLGRDLFVRVWYGARISLTIAVAVTFIDFIIGVIYGGVSGYFGGRVDQFMMRFVEILSSIPYLIVVLLLLAVIPRGLGAIILAYSLIGWTGMARLVRGQVLSLRQQDYLVAAHIMGASMGRIISKHLFPNILNLIIVNLTLDIPSVIFTEAFLSMLGLGIEPPMPSLGILAQEGIAVFRIYPTQLIAPALIICLMMFCLNVLGDKLQDAFGMAGRGISLGKRIRNKKPKHSV